MKYFFLILSFLICTLLPLHAKADTQAEFRVPILTYHAIGNYNGKGVPDLYVTEKNFKQQMQYLQSSGYTPITFEDFHRIEEITKPVLIAFVGGNPSVWKAFQQLEKMKSEDFDVKVTLFMAVDYIGKKLGLSPEQLKLMSDSGILSLQSHTFTNTDLTVTNNFTHELRDSKQKLEEITGQDVNAIAYPFGKYDKHVIQEVKKYYQYGITGDAGFVSEQSDPYKLRKIRVDVYTTMALFKEFVQPRQK